ncbi:DUF2794 domain-containing protein [Oricola cellulosilytica]|uniref:DUF2794 domain-containing protein n=2 Tax=Oricola cellulosilytica TaxID=1429082 RepID=A0A4V2MNP9_9HYPH|nr:DUF2794 domain-containing protein [Oricola cellulosilytica]
MTQPAAGASYDDGKVVPLAQGSPRINAVEMVRFERRELDQILRIYSMMVGAGEWRDYALDHMKDRAVFSVFRHSSEVPLYRIEKNPKLARRQGAFSLISASGQILKRGHELANVLKVFDKPLKLVASR